MNFEKQSSDLVVQALGAYQSIAACNEYLTRQGHVHSLTAALMLPCYRVEFERLVLQLTPTEEHQLRSALDRVAGTGPACHERATFGAGATDGVPAHASV